MADPTQLVVHAHYLSQRFPSSCSRQVMDPIPSIETHTHDRYRKSKSERQGRYTPPFTLHHLGHFLAADALRPRGAPCCRFNLPACVPDRLDEAHDRFWDSTLGTVEDSLDILIRFAPASRFQDDARKMAITMAVSQPRNPTFKILDFPSELVAACFTGRMNWPHVP